MRVRPLPPTKEDQASKPQATAQPVIIAHRGYSAVAPENTLAAYRAAIEAGAPAAECDVRCTRDGEVILLHDATLDRTTDGEGEVAEVTLAEVREVDAGSWKGAGFRGERIPTLRECLALTKGKLQLVVEIKQEGIARQVADAIGEAEALGGVTIISFSLDACRQMRDFEPRLPVGWLTSGLAVDDDEAASELIRTALEAGAQFIDVMADGVRPALLRRANLAGLALWTWTVNEPGRVALLARAGVRGITTDDPKMALQALDRTAAAGA